MMIIHKRYILLFVIFLFFFFLNCKEKEVIITKDYIINPYWDEIDNSFTFSKMILKNSENKNLRLQNVTTQYLLRELIKDTSFSFTANVKYDGEQYFKRKVYFNRNNGFVWRKPPDIDPSRNIKFYTLGELQQKTWYFCGGLGKEKTLYYVYLDSLDNLYTFKVPASAWTNY